MNNGGLALFPIGVNSGSGVLCLYWFRLVILKLILVNYEFYSDGLLTTGGGLRTS